MNASTSDYIIVNGQNNNKVHARIISESPFRAVVCDRHQKTKDKATYIEFEAADIVCNFGTKPTYGQVYGLAIEHVITRISNIEPWDNIYIYKKLSEAEHKLIMKSLKKVAAELLEEKIFPQEKRIDIFVKERKGLAGAQYKYNKKETMNDELTLRSVEASAMDYYIRHELGHGVWFQLLSVQERAKWIRAFYKNIDLRDDIENKMRKMRKELVEAGTIKTYKADLEDEEKEILDYILKHIDETYSVKPVHINLLLDDNDDLKDLWPKEALDIPQTKVLVSDYALTDPEELFCDSFAYYFDQDKKLPKSIQSLMQNTISVCRYKK